MICRASEPPPDYKEEHMTYKSDEEIRNDFLLQLGWDSQLKQSEIGVAVKKGVVILSGRRRFGDTSAAESRRRSRG